MPRFINRWWRSWTTSKKPVLPKQQALKCERVGNLYLYEAIIHLDKDVDYKTAVKIEKTKSAPQKKTFWSRFIPSPRIINITEDEVIAALSEALTHELPTRLGKSSNIISAQMRRNYNDNIAAKKGKIYKIKKSINIDNLFNPYQKLSTIAQRLALGSPCRQAKVWVFSTQKPDGIISEKSLTADNAFICFSQEDAKAIKKNITTHAANFDREDIKKLQPIKLSYYRGEKQTAAYYELIIRKLMTHLSKIKKPSKEEKSLIRKIQNCGAQLNNYLRQYKRVIDNKNSHDMHHLHKIINELNFYSSLLINDLEKYYSSILEKNRIIIACNLPINLHITTALEELIQLENLQKELAHPQNTHTFFQPTPPDKKTGAEEDKSKNQLTIGCL